MEEAKLLGGNEGGRACRYVTISLCSGNIGASLKFASVALGFESCLVAWQRFGRGKYVERRRRTTTAGGPLDCACDGHVGEGVVVEVDIVEDGHVIGVEEEVIAAFVIDPNRTGRFWHLE